MSLHMCFRIPGGQPTAKVSDLSREVILGAQHRQVWSFLGVSPALFIGVAQVQGPGLTFSLSWSGQGGALLRLQWGQGWWAACHSPSHTGGMEGEARWGSCVCVH